MSVKFVRRVFSDNSKGNKDMNGIKGDVLGKVLSTGSQIVGAVNQGVNNIKNGGKSVAELTQQSAELDVRIKALQANVANLAAEISQVKANTISYDALVALNQRYNTLFDEVEKMNKEVAEKQSKGYELAAKLVQLKILSDLLRQCNDKLPTSADPEIKKLLEEVGKKVTDERDLEKERDRSAEELEKAKYDKRENDETEKAIKEGIKEVEDKRDELKDIMPEVSPTTPEIDAAISKTALSISELERVLLGAPCNMTLTVTNTTVVDPEMVFSLLAVNSTIPLGSFNLTTTNVTQVADQTSAILSSDLGATPGLGGATPGLGGATPGLGGATPGLGDTPVDDATPVADAYAEGVENPLEGFNP